MPGCRKHLETAETHTGRVCAPQDCCSPFPSRRQSLRFGLWMGKHPNEVLQTDPQSSGVKAQGHCLTVTEMFLSELFSHVDSSM